MYLLPYNKLGFTLLEQFIVAVWIMLPVYMANNFATLLGGGRPLDTGRLFVDGKRILGNNKTVNGFALGTLGGIAVAVLQVIVAPSLSPYLSGPTTGYSFLAPPPVVIIALPLGALAGDAVKSFFKRRLGVASGARWRIADQLDFVLGAWALCFVANPGWFVACFTPMIMLIIVVITFPLQYFHNTIAVALGRKKVRW
jgi:CDP-2,3-bis-(O-geranylgeranyl)-sn-glycerol synthase